MGEYYADNYGVLYQIVEISSDNTYVSLDRGFLKVSLADGSKREIDFDEIAAVILSARSATVSRALLSELGRRTIPLVVSGTSYQPEYVGVPSISSAIGVDRAVAQVESSKPKRKRIWQSLVREKIQNQSRVLRFAGQSSISDKLAMIAKSVQSGDPNNREAYAAKLYWKALFGKEFSRDRAKPGRNVQLNYGYAIIRALVARSIASAGLLLGLGVHHSNSHNPNSLVDDLMEPYRPVVDWIVASLNDDQLSVQAKQLLSHVTAVDCSGSRGTTTLVNAVHEMVLSLSDVFLGKASVLSIPEWVPDDASTLDPQRI